MMNALARLENGIGSRSQNANKRLLLPLRKYSPSIVKSIMGNGMRLGRSAAGYARRYRLGDSVQHSAYGSGRVLAHWPDGRLLIDFDQSAKNELIYSSNLSRKEPAHRR